MIGELEKQELAALLRRQHLEHLGVRDQERVYVYLSYTATTAPTSMCNPPGG